MIKGIRLAVSSSNPIVFSRHDAGTQSSARFCTNKVHTFSAPFLANWTKSIASVFFKCRILWWNPNENSCFFYAWKSASFSPFLLYFLYLICFTVSWRLYSFIL